MIRSLGLAFVCALLTGPFAQSRTPWLDQGVEVFFPRSDHNVFLTYQEFSHFWWNFIVLEGISESDLEQIESHCQKLAAATEGKIDRLPCAGLAEPNLSWLRDWLSEQPRREALPNSKELRKIFKNAEGRLHLPASSEVLNLIRQDPFGALTAFQQRIAGSARFSRGYFWDPLTSRLILPVHIGTSPKEIGATESLLRQLQDLCSEGICGQAHLFGPHSANLQNRQQVERDVQTVSTLGFGLLGGFCLLLLLTRRGRALWLFLPIGLASALSVLIVVLVWGQIHGLVISFGFTIVGIAIDYGLHAGFGAGANQKRIWQANTLGLLTTLAPMIVFCFSEIPLIRQLMIFSILGLVLSFVFLRGFFHWHSAYFQLPEIKSLVPAPPGLGRATVVIVGLGFVALFYVQPNFSLQSFDFQNPQSRAMQEWTFQQLGVRSPLLLITEASDLAEAQQKSQELVALAAGQGWRMDSAVSDLSHASPENLAAWKNFVCQPEQLLSALQLELFQPYFSLFDCRADKVWQASPTPRQEALRSGPQWLTVLQPKSEQEELKMRALLPAARTSAEVFQEFPKYLVRDLFRLIPISFLLIVVLVYWRFPQWEMVALIVFPFIAGVGLYLSFVWILKLQFGFMSLLAMMLLLGFSVDYGIFIVESRLHSLRTGNSEVLALEDGAVKSGIAIAAASNILGIAPMWLAKHPVLLQLGQALFLGTVGALLGSWVLFQARKLNAPKRL